MQKAGKGQRKCSWGCIRWWVVEFTTEDPTSSVTKCRKTFFIDKSDLRLLCLGRAAALPSQDSETLSQCCALDRMSRLRVQPELMSFSVQLPYHRPCHRLIHCRELSMGWQCFHKTPKDWDGYNSPAALTPLCWEPALVPALALQEEQGSACETGLCSFWIGTEMLQSREIRWKDCVCWGGTAVHQRDWVLLLKC